MVYADTAATTKVDPVVAEYYTKNLISFFGNPASQHEAGMSAYKLLEDARKNIAEFMNCHADCVFFTSGGTESNNWALYNALPKRDSHAIVSSIEHPSVISFLESNGFDYSLIPVDSRGVCAVEEIKKLIKPTTSVISVMAANNETGVLQPISHISEIAHEHNLIFHSDAVQYVGHIPWNFKSGEVDFVSFSGHKFNCPKGIGALVANTDKLKTPYIFGGGQERGFRSGTQNAPLAAAMALALEQSQKDDFSDMYVSSLKNHLRNDLLENIPDVKIITPETDCVPGILNIALPGIKGESLRIFLNMRGICVSTGSACSSGKHEQSQTLIAMELDNDTVEESIRISFDRFNSENDITIIVNALKEAVKLL